MKLAVRAVPSARIAVVHGFPDSEENSLRIAAALPQRLPGWRIVLLCEDPVRAGAAFRLVLPGWPVPELVRRISVRGFALAIIARLWVHTHGLYGSPRGSRSRLSVLVGHGHGPKRAVPYGAVTHRHHADLAFTNVAVWGTTIIRELGVPESSPVVVAASPRADGLVESSFPPVERSRDAMPVETPYALWLPTVRRTVAMRRDQWQDGVRLTEDAAVALEVATLARTAEAHGLRLVTKVHELDADADAFAALGIQVVTSADLEAAGITFGQFVQGAAALVTDYSSVFVDHLQTELSIAFWMPDLAEFTGDRGFNSPGVAELAPELILRGLGDAGTLFGAAARGETWQPTARARLAEGIGYVGGSGQATELVVDEIVARLRV